MRVNGYEIEPGASGAWWVRLPGSRLSWRFESEATARGFASKLRPPGHASPAVARDRRRAAATDWGPETDGGATAGLERLLSRLQAVASNEPATAPNGQGHERVHEEVHEQAQAQDRARAAHGVPWGQSRWRTPRPVAVSVAASS